MKDQRPIVGASVLVKREGGDVLLVERLNDPGRGEWALPGGKVDYGETVEHAAVREVKEETNVDVELRELLGAYNIIGEKYHFVTISFLGEPKTTDIVSGADVGLADWINPENLGKKALTETTVEALNDAEVL